MFIKVCEFLYAQCLSTFFNSNMSHCHKGVYYIVTVRRIWPYSGYGMPFLQANQCCLRFSYYYAVAENWNLKRVVYGFSPTS